MNMDDENLASELRAGFQGKLIGPGDGDYDEARKVWNGMVDKKPALIAQCAGTSDVVAAVNLAREKGLPLAVRCGAHNVSGNAVCEDGIVVDLRPMKRVEVDAEGRIARAAGGVTWGEYDKATQAHGLASPGGAISTTGIAGLTLGGGFGWLSRSQGLACDNVISAEVVTAGGDVLTASADENADLYWGIRGGGGNFGVVTRFDYRLRPVGELYAGLLLYPRSEAPAFMRMYAELTAGAPDKLSSMAAMLSTPDGDPVVGVLAVYNGPSSGCAATPGFRASTPAAPAPCSPSRATTLPTPGASSPSSAGSRLVSSCAPTTAWSCPARGTTWTRASGACAGSWVSWPRSCAGAGDARRLGCPTSGHRIALEGMEFSWCWNDGTIFPNPGYPGIAGHIVPTPRQCFPAHHTA